MTERRFPYDTILDKDPALLQRELDQLSLAGAVTVARGVAWVVDKIDPGGPVMRAHDLSIHAKTAWLFAADGHTLEAARLLDWLGEQALRPTGDVCFPDDPAFFRVYRQSYVQRAAARIGHGLHEAPNVEARMCQFQDPDSGGVFEYIGEDPDRPELPDMLGLSATCNFGHYAIEAGLEQPARRAGDWLVGVIAQNRPHIEQGRFYADVGRDGEIKTDVAPGAELDGVVDAGVAAMQTTWRLGICMTFLAELYHACRTRWSDGADPEPYLEAALLVLGLQDRMPIETYFNLNACKVGWGAGRLLDVVVTHDRGTPTVLDQLYRACRRTYMHTFLGTRRADGSWTHDFYPLDSRAPEMAVDVRTLEGLPALPDPTWRADAGTNAVVGDIETTAEHTAWTVHVLEGIDRLRAAHYAGQVTLGGAQSA
jgi:hypothetical protein